MKKNKFKITVEFITETQVELTIGNRIAVVDTPHHESARKLAALAEADLLDINDDAINVRVIGKPLKQGDRVVTETRHGKQMFIAKSRKGQRRLISIYDVANAANN